MTLAKLKSSEGITYAVLDPKDGGALRRVSETSARVESSADLWCGPDDELLDSRDAALLLTVKRSTLLAWVRDGRVPVVRLGPRHLRWTRPLLREIREAALDPGRRF